MGTSFTWLHTSLFCSKESWHLLLSKGIAPFLKSRLKNSCSSFYLQFNYLSGENIRLSILCTDNAKESTAIEIDKYFKDFFNTSGFPQKKYQLPIAGVFLPFNSNTIHYGLYDFASIKISSSLNEALSKVMIAAFIDDEVDDDSLITVTFYLCIYLATKVRAVPFAEGQPIDLASTKAPSEQTDLVQATVNEKFEQNKYLFLEIYRDIRDGGSGLPKWLPIWRDMVDYNINKFKHGTGPQGFHGFCLESVYRQFGLSNNMIMFLEGIVRKTIGAI